MMRNWIPVCLMLAGLATLMSPSTAEAFGRRNRGGSACCETYAAAPVHSGCCGTGYSGYSGHHGYSGHTGYSGYSGHNSGYMGMGHGSYMGMSHSSGCNSCGGSVYSGQQHHQGYAAGGYSSGMWSGGACGNCGPSTSYSGTMGQHGMAGHGNDQNIQQANYATNGGGTVVLTVPENAEVMWGGQPVYGTGATRRFVTLPIQGNNGAQQFQVRWMGPNGQWVTRNQSINAAAGQSVSYDFTNPNAAANGQAGGQFGTEEAQPNPNGQNPNQPGSGTDLNPATPRKLPNPGTGANPNTNPGSGTGTPGSGSTIGSGTGTGGSGTGGNNNNNKKNREENNGSPRE
ncbi:MAG: hypothetical protein K2X38_16880 [Gemmataceae bacterium]|nr:hypothetical protein [Gemmataceae bacterium]